jgi:hypothetical protein
LKALLASALTALVFVTAAWASNVTPAQFSALSKRVSKLERQNAAMTRSLAFAQKDNARVAGQTHSLALRLGDLEASVAADEAYSDKCLAFQPVVVYTVTIHHDGSPDETFPSWSTPAAGDKPAFWSAVTTDSSCFAP